MRFGERLGCHQIADRSFTFRGYQFPVCARCTGVIIGEFVALPILLCGFRLHFFLCLLLILPLVADGGLQYINVYRSTNLRRVITGFFAGVGLTYLYCYLIEAFVELLIYSLSFAF